MQRGKFNVVTDGQFGSCGKGAIASALAAKYRPEILTTTNGPGAGHTAVNTDGTAFVAKAIPSPSILAKWLDGYKPHVLIGGGASFTLDQIAKEIQECGVADLISIHPRAGVVTDEHKQIEAGDGASSTKHLASTMQGGGACLADKVMRKKGLKLARDYNELANYLATNLPLKVNLPEAVKGRLSSLSLPEILNSLMTEQGYTILHEGAQGYSLDITHGHSFPQCTSRGTTAIQNIADMGISLRDVGDIYLVIRPYPIRVGNLVVDNKQLGHSGGCYNDQQEISWQQVAEEAGMPKDEADKLTTKELTTVTKRLRRVFTFSDSQLREAALVNGATKIALNFANYIDYAVSGVSDYEKLTPKVKDFIVRVEDVTKLPVTIVGTGPQLNHICII